MGYSVARLPALKDDGMRCTGEALYMKENIKFNSIKILWEKRRILGGNPIVQ